MKTMLAPNGALPTPCQLPLTEPLLEPSRLASLPRHEYDVVVVGAGVAGLAFTLRLPDSIRAVLLTKGRLGESNTRYAQGGLSAAIGLDDSPELHEADTLAAGAGLCDLAAVRALVEGAPEAVAWLLDAGARFDRDATTGELQLGREAAHSRRRVLHAGGDATGAEIERALVVAVRARPNVDVHEDAFALDLLVEDGRVAGLIAELDGHPGLVRLASPLVVIAAGGAGQLWATTSNPLGATADGLAIALRAGVAVADLEFVQFHPTVLALPGAEPFLVSEAVRGEGAYLRAANGERFMSAIHPLAELAPRDVVARAIQRQMALDGAVHVSLDLCHLDGASTRNRFPTIARQLAARGLDLTADLIPVAPAAHYFMGGIVADPTGETSLPGLLALGEASCTGVHGANRLASNSLLEGLVFGLAAAERVMGNGKWGLGDRRERARQHAAPRAQHSVPANQHLVELRLRLQRTMSRHVAVVRDARGLEVASVDILAVANALRPRPSDHRSIWELRNMALAASAIVAAASLREESRGAHYRSDFPETDPTLNGQRLVCQSDDADHAWHFGHLTDVLAQIAARP
ncbi:MAG: L-aspartate oxidase [Thermomicrobiales bacterium]